MLTLARAGAVVLVAALRVSLLWRFRPLDAVVRDLRSGRPLRGALCAPELYGRLVGRLASRLPPWGLGLCLRRSLLLLHLWSRCGLRPRLQLGFAAGAPPGGRGHAWLEVGGTGLEPFAGTSLGHVPAFTFEP